MILEKRVQHFGIYQLIFPSNSQTFTSDARLIGDNGRMLRMGLREAKQPFYLARMMVSDEIKSRTKLMQVNSERGEWGKETRGSCSAVDRALFKRNITKGAWDIHKNDACPISGLQAVEPSLALQYVALTRDIDTREHLGNVDVCSAKITGNWYSCNCCIDPV